MLPAILESILLIIKIVTGFAKTDHEVKSHLADCILLAQLIDTLIHYPCTVVLMGLVDLSAFLELVNWPMEGTRWEEWVLYSPLC